MKNTSLPKILLLETATAACSVALSCEGHIFSKHVVQARVHGDLILPMVDELLSEAGLSGTDLDAMAVSQGPGSFVGVRLGVSVAQGLAFGWNLPVMGLCSLEIQALSIYQRFGLPQFVLGMNAHMGSVYCAGFEFGPEAYRRTFPGQLVAAENFVSVIQDHFGTDKIIPVVGDAWLAYPHLNQSCFDVQAWQEAYLPNAAAGLSLAISHYQQQALLPPESLSPVYWQGESLWKKTSL